MLICARPFSLPGTLFCADVKGCFELLKKSRVALHYCFVWTQEAFNEIGMPLVLKPQRRLKDANYVHEDADGFAPEGNGKRRIIEFRSRCIRTASTQPNKDIPST